MLEKEENGRRRRSSQGENSQAKSSQEVSFLQALVLCLYDGVYGWVISSMRC
jgi:hypothetical protein